MESFSTSFQPYKSAHSEVFIQSQQDGLFFGLDYLKNYLRFDDPDQIKVYFSDGDCVFKNQTLLSLSEENIELKKEDLLSAISYLSGAYTLISCFSAKNFNFSICADLTSDFELSRWEEQAILKAGAVVRAFPKNFLSLEQVQNKLKQKSGSIVLSEFKISRDTIKSCLKTADSSIRFDLHGSFLPSDLEGFREFENIGSVYSVYLQGSFPCLPMKFLD